MKPARALTPEFKRDLQEGGILAPLLDLVKKDRHLLLEIRCGYIDLYFKGNGLIKVLALGSSEYAVTSHDKFAAGAALGPLKTEANVEDLIKEIPRIKHRIATNKSYASEIEIEHLLIRMNNRERGVNSEYFAVDRQGVYGPADVRDRIDVLGVCWPRANRTTSAKLDLCVMEVKFAMGAKIGEIEKQLKRYHEILSADIQTVARDAQALRRDKIDLGLLGIDKRLEKLKTLEISDRMDDVRWVIVLAEQNPYSKSLDPRSLSSVLFRRIEIFRVGFGLWSCDAYRLENGAWQRPPIFGETPEAQMQNNPRSL